MSRTCVRSTRIVSFGLATVLGASVLAPSAHADSLPIEVGGKDRIATAIRPVGDEDVFHIHLFPGDKLTAKIREAGPDRGIEPVVFLDDPSGNNAFPIVTQSRNGKRNLKFTTFEEGVHALRILGHEDGFAGADGNYTLTLNVRRAKIRKTKFLDEAGGNISVLFGAADGALVTLTARTKKGGVTLTELKRPDSTPEPEFLNALKVPAKNQRSGKLRQFPLTGGGGMYELVGTYAAGSKVSVSVKVKHNDVKRTRRMEDLEPGFHPQLTPGPREAIEGVEFLVVGENLQVLFDENENKILPRFWIGSVEVPADSVNHIGGQQFKFPIPAGLTPNRNYALTVRNDDGQAAELQSAFFYILPPEIYSLDITAGGPAGGRKVQIAGNRIRAGTLVLFDNRVVAPRSTGSTTELEATSPPHAPGTVDVTLRGPYGQTATLQGGFTYLDIGSNRIAAIDPPFLLGTGGQAVTVLGDDFVADSVITLAGGNVNAQLVDPTQMTFTSAARTAGEYDLRVTDQYEQPSQVKIAVKGFTDATATAIPAPSTATRKADGWRATRVLHGDVDGDEVADVVLLRPERIIPSTLDDLRSRVRVLLGDGDGAFTDDTENAMPAVSLDDDWRAEDGALVDVDDDDDLDLVLIHTDAFAVGTDGFPTRPSLRLLLNDGKGVFTDGTSAGIPALPTYDATDGYDDHLQGVAVIAADVDGQDGPDLVIVHTNSFRKRTVLDPGDPGDPLDPINFPPTPPTYQHDYFAGTRILLNDGDGVFTYDPTAIPGPDAPPDPDNEPQSTDMRYHGGAVAGGAVGTTGAVHLIVTRTHVLDDPLNPGTFLSSSTFLENDGSGAFTDTTSTALPAVSDPDFLQASGAVFVDVNDDQDDDLVLSLNTRLVAPGALNPSQDSATRIYLNDGNGAFTRTGAPTIQTAPNSFDRNSNQASDIAVADVTNDGRPDIVMTSTNAPNTGDRAARILVQGVDGNFTRGEAGLPNPLGGDMRGADVALLDVDTDGDLDILIGRDESDDTVRNTFVLRNPAACTDFTDGANGFSTPFQLTNGIDPDDDPQNEFKLVTSLEVGRRVTLAPTVTYNDVGGGSTSDEFVLEMHIDGLPARSITIPSLADGASDFVHDYGTILFSAIGEYCVELRVNGTLTRRETVTVVRAP